MADPYAILLVPTEAGAALLDVGPALPVHPGADVGMTRRGRPPCIMFHGAPDALPLWWDGVSVPEGWDRARRVWHETEDVDRDELLDAARSCWPLTEQVLVLARALAFDGLCRVVLLDLVDGALVERAS